jgi:hypothetical protein
MQKTTNKRPHRHEYLWWWGKRKKKDAKSNLNHNSTRSRESHKINRELKYRVYGILYESYTWGFDPLRKWMYEDELE